MCLIVVFVYMYIRENICIFSNQKKEMVIQLWQLTFWNLLSLIMGTNLIL